MPTAKKLILGLLLAREGEPLNVRDAIDACALFDITANNVRVTLARLSAEGLISAAGRGAYCMGPAAQPVAAQITRWHEAERRLRPWHGNFIAVHCGNLGRSDRKALHRRERALEMLGLRELARGLYLRPDNLAGGVVDLRGRLQALGLEPEGVVFEAGGFDEAREREIRTLWNSKALNADYAAQGKRLKAWLARSDRLEPGVAARESYLLGSEAIRRLVFDPWLPAPLVDEIARHEFFETVRQFDETGKAIWHRLFAAKASMSVAASVSQLSEGVLP